MRVNSRTASPLDNEGRGLKQVVLQFVDEAGRGFAPRQRGAWIETCSVGIPAAFSSGFAPRQRGAWIETQSPLPGSPVTSASPLDNEGRGLKPWRRQPAPLHANASPLDNEGRGLKLEVHVGGVVEVHRFAPRQRGAWIET